MQFDALVSQCQSDKPRKRDRYPDPSLDSVAEPRAVDTTIQSECLLRCNTLQYNTLHWQSLELSYSTQCATVQASGEPGERDTFAHRVVLDSVTAVIYSLIPMPYPKVLYEALVEC